MVLSPLLVVLILSPQMFNWCPFSTDVQWLSSFLSLSVVPPLLHHSMAILCPQLVGGCPFSRVTNFFSAHWYTAYTFLQFFVKISLCSIFKTCLLKKFAVSKLHEHFEYMLAYQEGPNPVKRLLSYLSLLVLVTRHVQLSYFI